MVSSQKNYGLIALMGSGETTPSGGRIFDYIASCIEKPVNIAVLETPAGFELNSEKVAGKVVDYLKIRLQNYDPEISQIPARKTEGNFSPNSLEILQPLHHANMIFMGPGSPTYAVRLLASSSAWEMVRISHRYGTALVLASAATIAFGSQALPVYEIFKVGEDLHWKPGLNFMQPFGLSVVVIPHWNNHEGGKDLDTSRCFMGKDRFSELCTMLPKDTMVLGIDEQTGVVFDLNSGECLVLGSGKIHLVTRLSTESISAKTKFPLNILGPFKLPVLRDEGLNIDLLKLMFEKKLKSNEEFKFTERVKQLIAAREKARDLGNWNESDRIREILKMEGWGVKDTPGGQVLEKE